MDGVDTKPAGVICDIFFFLRECVKSRVEGDQASPATIAEGTRKRGVNVES